MSAELAALRLFSADTVSHACRAILIASPERQNDAWESVLFKFNWDMTSRGCSAEVLAFQRELFTDDVLAEAKRRIEEAHANGET